MAEVGKIEFEGKRCYSFEEISVLENRLTVLEAVVMRLNTILYNHIGTTSGALPETANANRKD